MTIFHAHQWLRHRADGFYGYTCALCGKRGTNMKEWEGMRLQSRLESDTAQMQDVPTGIEREWAQREIGINALERMMR